MIYLTLKQFLEFFPWEKNYENENKLDFLWKFELKNKPSDLWEYLSDTSSTNKELGLPVMHFEQKEGKLYGKSKVMGFDWEWEEVPWQWEYPRMIKSARIYSKGFAKYVRAMYLFYDVSEFPEYQKKTIKTILYIYFGWIPRNKITGKILKIVFKNLEKKYNELLNKIDKKIKEKNQQTELSIFSEEEINLIKKIYVKTEEEILKKHYEKIINHLTRKSEDFLYRIRIKKIALDLNLDFFEVLKFFLISTKKGVFILTWDIICPHCKGAIREILNLGDLPEIESCDVCKIDFSSATYKNIEVIFRFHPSIKKIEKRFYCAAEPAKKNHILVQRRLMPEEVFSMDLDFPFTDLRLRWNYEKNYIFIKIKETGRTDFLATSKEVPDLIELKPESRIVVKNYFNEPRDIILETNYEDTLVLRPDELFNFQDFRVLFNDQILSSGIRLDIGIQNLMLIDVVGSTKLYLEKGESYAFRVIKKFYEIQYEFIKKHNGSVIKTLGDAVFASLSNAKDLVLCSQELIQECRKNLENPIRICLNIGPVYAVNLNTGIDYFGTPVNLLAKMENYVKEYEIAIPEEVIENYKEIKELLTNFQKLRTEKILLPLNKEFIYGVYKIKD